MSSAEEATARKPSHVPDEGIDQAKLPPRTQVGSLRKFASVPAFSDDIDSRLAQEAEGDAGYTKTWSRRIVEGVLQNRTWYFPKRTIQRGADGEEPPTLSKAWAYYEHFTLARYLVDQGHQRAEPGDTRESRLYNPFTTPESTLNEWGLGVGVYFSTLRIMAIMLVVLGLINIPNIIFFQSDEYSDGQEGVSFTLTGSAICTRGTWQACPSCDPDDFSSGEENNRLGITDQGQLFVLRNACDYDDILTQGMVNYASCFFAIVFLGLISIYQRKKETIFDEDKLTSTDYSVLVKNPPKEALDPDDWNSFFSQFGKVTFVTIALNNGPLLNKLTSRRIFMNSLRSVLPKGLDMEDEDGVRFAAANLERELEAEPKGCIRKLLNCTLFPILRIFNMFLLPTVLFEKVVTLTEEIKELQKQKYHAVQVFVTFETEEGQRTALSALKVVSKFDAITNRARNNVPLFQTSASTDGTSSSDGVVLRVDEPKEPSAVRWQDLHVSSTTRIIQRLINFTLTVGIVAGAGVIVALVRNELGPGYSGPLVSVFNSIIPVIVHLLMLFESHHSEGSRQESLYLKITLFRWVNTAILTQIITPFTSTVSNGSKDVLVTISAILWSELLVVPFLRLLDIVGTLKKHILAPRAVTQEQMNLSFQGTPYNLGERYTDLTKILFLCFFYSALFPGSFFFCGAILFVQYYVDKICLMRVWAPAPFLGTELAKFSRRYFFSTALLAFGIVSSFAWAQFPYDNLCDPEEPTGSNFTGAWTVTLLTGEVTDIGVIEPEPAVFCNQNWRDYDGFPFPATSRLQDGRLDWMTESQVTLTDVYGISTVVLLAIFVAAVFGGTLLNFLVSFYRGTYKPQGRDQKIDFSTVPEISAYIPQINVRAFPFPLIACSLKGVDRQFIGWNDRSDSNDDRHNMIYDVPYEGMEGQGDEGASSPIFSIVKHWPPAWTDKTE